MSVDDILELAQKGGRGRRLRQHKLFAVLASMGESFMGGFILSN